MTDTFSISSRIKSITKVPSFNTKTIAYGNKVEQRIAVDSLPRYKFQLTFVDVLSDTVMDEIMTFTPR